ncbi:MAG TPA: nitroreductase family protein, partial [Sedimentibacter sp.]|nr:nitroreductase family protein [Sedimentibacter sp.]
MEFDMLNLIMKRRSIRKFKDEKLSEKQIQELVNAGILAPTSRNNKAVELIVVDDADTILKLKDCRNMGTKGLQTAPCAIVVIGDSEKSDVWVEDASISASYMQLRAEDLGLGSVWIQMRKRVSDKDSSENEVKKVLNIPDKYGVLCILAIGYKDENKEPY